MSESGANLSVAVGDRVVVVKIDGRASFKSSGNFKSLVYGLHAKGHDCFVLELKDCLLMDSTFLGVLAGMGLQFEKSQGRSAALHLLHPSERISDLLENLGVARLFTVLDEQQTALPRLEPVANPEPTDSKAVSRLCLEAHRTLMEINPANIPKFKDVVAFLAEDLAEGDGAEQKPEQAD